MTGTNITTRLLSPSRSYQTVRRSRDVEEGDNNRVIIFLVRSRWNYNSCITYTTLQLIIFSRHNSHSSSGGKRFPDWSHFQIIVPTSVSKMGEYICEAGFFLQSNFTLFYASWHRIEISFYFLKICLKVFSVRRSVSCWLKTTVLSLFLCIKTTFGKMKTSGNLELSK